MSDLRFREFFEDDKGVGSAARLNMVIGVGVGSVAVLWLAGWFKLPTELFAVYMLATGGVYGFGKWRESIERVEQTKADAPQPAVVPVTVPAAAPTTMSVAVNGQADKQAKDVNISAEGDVTVQGGNDA